MEMFSDLERPPLPTKSQSPANYLYFQEMSKGGLHIRKLISDQYLELLMEKISSNLENVNTCKKIFLILKFSLKRTVFLKQRYQQYVLEVIIYELKCSSTKIDNKSILDHNTSVNKYEMTSYTLDHDTSVNKYEVTSYSKSSDPKRVKLKKINKKTISGKFQNIWKVTYF